MFLYVLVKHGATLWCWAIQSLDLRDVGFIIIPFNPKAFDNGTMVEARVDNIYKGLYIYY